MKPFLIVLGLIALIWLGLAGTQDATVERIQAMQDHCRAGEPDCRALIASVQAGNHFQVYSQNGVYWAESTNQ